MAYGNSGGAGLVPAKPLTSGGPAAPKPVGLGQAYKNALTAKLVGRARQDYYAPKQPPGPSPYATPQFGSALAKNPAFIKALQNLAAGKPPSVNMAQAYKNLGGARY